MFAVEPLSAGIAPVAERAIVSRTFAITCSSGNSVDGLTFDISELRSQTPVATFAAFAAGVRSQVTNVTSASGSAAGVWSSPATESARSFCGL
jgi:hypothetical protein